MAIIQDHTGKQYRPCAYEREDAFEKDVVRLAGSIFGPDAIYIDVKRRISGNSIVSIPDGYVINMTESDEPQLFVVENEIVGHDPFKHIGIQMLRFVTSFEEAQADIRNFLMEEIAKLPSALEKLESNCSKSSKRNIDNYLDAAVYGPFRGLVIIDEARPELHKVISRINADISVLELRAFTADDGSLLHQFETLYEDEGELSRDATRVLTAGERKARRLRRAKADTIIVPAREEGFRKVFLGENQWHAIRIGAAMKDRIKYIAGYQIRPVSAVTHIAEVKEIRPYQDTGKYVVLFAGPAREIAHIPLGDPSQSPQGPVYTVRGYASISGIVRQVLKYSRSEIGFQVHGATSSL